MSDPVPSPSAFNSSDHLPLTLDLSEPPFAIIKIHKPLIKNALAVSDFKLLSSYLQDIDARPEFKITIVTATGDYFSAGGDLEDVGNNFRQVGEDGRLAGLGRLAGSSLDLTRALYSHSKILVAGLNGPAIGFSAAMLGHFDLLYGSPRSFILMPFSAMSLVAEGGASFSLPRRLGVSKANEALLFGKKLNSTELLQLGFLNKVLPPSDDFFTSLMEYLRDAVQGLDLDAALVTKHLMRASLSELDAANIREMYAMSDAFASGKPAEAFKRITGKQIRHKL